MSKRAELERAIRMREIIVQAMSGLSDVQSQFAALLEDCERRILCLTVEVHSTESPAE